MACTNVLISPRTDPSALTLSFSLPPSLPAATTMAFIADRKLPSTSTEAQRNVNWDIAQ
jgi:hypothetical protein